MYIFQAASKTNEELEKGNNLGKHFMLCPAMRKVKYIPVIDFSYIQIQ